LSSRPGDLAIVEGGCQACISPNPQSFWRARNLAQMAILASAGLGNG